MVRSSKGTRRTARKRAPIDFDLRQLEVFSKVVELGSVSRAAAAVRLTQSSVSERIATLERAVGAKLFDRVARKMVPTATGKLLFEYARRHLALKEETRQALRGHLGLLSGDLSIAGSTIPGEYILPQLIGEFRRQHPEITVRLRIQGSAAVANSVADGSAELGVTGAVISIKGLKYQQLWDDELVLIVPSGHRWTKGGAVKLSELSSEPFVMRGEGSGTRAEMEQQLRAAHGGLHLELNVGAELGSSAAVKAAVAAGLGVSMVSRRAVTAEVKHKTLAVVPLADLRLPRSFYLVRDQRRSLAPLAAAFRKALLADAAGGR